MIWEDGFDKGRKMKSGRNWKECHDAFTRLIRPTAHGDYRFSNDVESVVLLNGIGPSLTNPEMEAFATAAKQFGEEGLCLVLLWEGIAEGADRFHYIPIDQIQSYFELRTPHVASDNAILAPSGTWGLILYADRWGILGGPQLLVEAVLKTLGRTKESEIRNFLSEVKENQTIHNAPIDASELGDLIAYICGKELAEAYLREAGLV